MTWETRNHNHSLREHLKLKPNNKLCRFCSTIPESVQSKQMKWVLKSQKTPFLSNLANFSNHVGFYPKSIDAALPRSIQCLILLSVKFALALDIVSTFTDRKLEIFHFHVSFNSSYSIPKFAFLVSMRLLTQSWSFGEDKFVSESFDLLQIPNLNQAIERLQVCCRCRKLQQSALCRPSLFKSL